MRGYSCIALDRVKDPANIGGALRAAHIYGADLLVLGGTRYGKFHADTTDAARHVPLIKADDVFSALPHGCVPVAVDLIPGAIPLPEYKHPERAFYVFGGEDSTLGEAITSQCRDVVYVPTSYCMNLAASANVILYDRMVKRGGWMSPAKFMQAAE